jgi:shikimate kinase
VTDGQPKAPLIVLTGPPAAGKSSVGRLLAERLGAAFVDTDAEIEAAAGKPVGDIFVDDGEAAFRDLERAAAQRALTAPGAVVALGSGAVTDPGVQQMLADQPVAYLSAGFPAIARRLGLDRPRVVLPGNPRGQLRRMLDERRPLYERLAAVTVQADELAPEEIADEIADWLASRPGTAAR